MHGGAFPAGFAAVLDADADGGTYQQWKRPIYMR